MKKLLIISVLAIIGFSANAQWQQTWLKTHKSRATLLHKNNKPLFTFLTTKATSDSPKSMIALNDSIYDWNWDTTKWGYSDKTIHIVYNAHQYVSTDIIQFWSSNAWVNGSQDSNTYDANNKLKYDLRQTWSGTAWTNSHLTTYTYNTNNYMISDLTKSWNGTSWVNEGLYTQYYDSHNNMTSSTDLYWSGTDWAGQTH